MVNKSRSGCAGFFCGIHFCRFAEATRVKFRPTIILEWPDNWRFPKGQWMASFYEACVPAGEDGRLMIKTTFLRPDLLNVPQSWTHPHAPPGPSIPLATMSAQAAPDPVAPDPPCRKKRQGRPFRLQRMHQNACQRRT